jgi:hypothetical protein
MGLGSGFASRECADAPVHGLLQGRCPASVPCTGSDGDAACVALGLRLAMERRASMFARCRGDGAPLRAEWSR